MRKKNRWCYFLSYCKMVLSIGVLFIVCIFHFSAHVNAFLLNSHAIRCDNGFSFLSRSLVRSAFIISSLEKRTMKKKNYLWLHLIHSHDKFLLSSYFTLLLHASDAFSTLDLFHLVMHLVRVSLLSIFFSASIFSLTNSLSTFTTFNELQIFCVCFSFVILKIQLDLDDSLFSMSVRQKP